MVVLYYRKLSHHLKVVKRKSDIVYPTKATHLSGNKRITTNIFGKILSRGAVSATVSKERLGHFYIG